MYFEEAPAFNPQQHQSDTAHTNTVVAPPPGSEDPVDFTQYSASGFSVVNAEFASSGHMMFAYDNQGHALGVAYDNGNGSWQDEKDALGNAFLCAGGIYAIAQTEGLASYVIGAATAYQCDLALEHIGELSSQYYGSDQAYTQGNYLSGP